MKTAVVLGAYGLIGAASVRALMADGFAVTGVGRSYKAGPRSDPGIRWITVDLAQASPADWRAMVEGADVVINAAGVLQDGARDNLRGIHVDAVGGLVQALANTSTRLVQVSAAGVSDEAPTQFLRTKMEGDRIVMQSALDWVILRPTLVFGPQAYGGTALLRAAAAFPLVCPRVLPDSLIQTVALDDVGRAVVQAARGEIASGTVADLTEGSARTLAETFVMLRRWQGFGDWRYRVRIPAPMLWPVARISDALGWLGWRSPLRTTAIRTLRDGVTGNPAAWRDAGGLPCKPLAETLGEMPATTQERWFARTYLMLPIMVAALSVFWLASGLIGLARMDAARAVLTDRGVGAVLAAISAAGGTVADLALGLAVLYRPLARSACLGMVALSGAYLAAATIFAPDLWADPLGPLVKVLPAIVLSLVTAAILDER